MRTRISFIILNYNTSDLVFNCVESIKKYIPAGTYEIIVVDNHSTENEYESLCNLSLGDSCKIVRSRWNGGFGMGNMLGANAAEGEFLCFINSDVEFTEDCCTPLCDYLSRNPGCGCITPQQTNGNGDFVPSFKHKFGIRKELLGNSVFERLFPKEFPPRHNYIKGKIIKVPEINGCFILIPSNKFWKCGGFDTNIFLYYEEYDLARRLEMCGWHCVLDTSYTFRHLGAKSTKQAKSSSYRELFVSKMYVYAKYHGALMTLIFKSLNLIKLLVKVRKWNLIPIVCRGNSLVYSMRRNLPAYNDEKLKR